MSAADRLQADLDGALLVDPKRTRAFLRIDDVRAVLAMRSKDHSTAVDDVRRKVTEVITFNRHKSSDEIADAVLTAIGSQSK